MIFKRHSNSLPFDPHLFCREITVKISSLENEYLGSGVLLHRSLVLTCHHVIKNHDDILISTVSDNICNSGNISIISLAKLSLLYFDIKYKEDEKCVSVVRPGKKLDENKLSSTDLCFIKLGQAIPFFKYRIRIKDISFSWVKDLYAFGYPEKEFPDGWGFKTELLSGVSKKKDEFYKDLTVCYLDGRPEPGMSGGAVIDLSTKDLLGIIRGYEIRSGLPITDSTKTQVHAMSTENRGCQTIGLKNNITYIQYKLSELNNEIVHSNFYEKIRSATKLATNKLVLVGVIFAIFASLFNAAGFILSKKLAIESISLGANAGGAVAVAGILCMLIGLISIHTSNKRSNSSYYILFKTIKQKSINFLIFWVAIEFAFVIGALYFLSPTEVRATVAISPIIALVIQKILFKKNFKHYGTLNILIFSVGLALILFNEVNATRWSNPDFLAGICMCLIGAFGWVMYLWSLKYACHMDSDSPEANSFAVRVFRLGFINLMAGLLIVTVFNGWKDFSVIFSDYSLLLLFIFNGLRITIVYLLHQEALRLLPIIIADFLASLGVLFMLFFDVLFLNRPLTHYDVLGVLLIFISLQLINEKVKQRQGQPIT